MSEKHGVEYSSYLQLDKILDSQAPESDALATPAHDEMLFIVVHQTYELWFKQIIHELNSVMTMFKDHYVDERNIDKAVSRLNRINEILSVLIDQISIMETMTPLDFLEFRNLLTPASGFQSLQFRIIEIKLGLKPASRVKYSKQAYHHMYDEGSRIILELLEDEPTLYHLLENWLERIPFLEFPGFNFLETYQAVVTRMLAEERELIEKAQLSKEDREGRLRLMDASRRHFDSLFEEDQHNQFIREGRRRLSYKATLAVLLINLYRDQPILQLPYRLLAEIVEIDERISTWRYRHALMVLRMIGRKTGTGGSAGYSYLKKTAEEHRVYADLFNISTFLVPRSKLPDLPESVERDLGYYFSQK